jgi:uncharacterized phage protein (TIGR01671 family)
MGKRPIKFRAWHKGEAFMIDWDLIVDDGILAYFASDDYELMQYTGMKAKDGKDIYEGDIVVADRYPFFNDGVPGYVGVIEWAHAAWYYGLECVNDKLAGSAVGDQLGAPHGKEVTEFRIIGNIHEHPHLLSGGN